MPMNIKGMDGPETVQIEMLPRNYFSWKGKLYDGHYEEEINEQGEKVKVYKGDRIWVPAAVANELTANTDPKRPLCKIIGTRSKEDVLEENVSTGMQKIVKENVSTGKKIN